MEEYASRGGRSLGVRPACGGLPPPRCSVTEMKEHVQDAADLLAHWVDAFNMVLNDEGAWDWSQVMEEHAEHIAQLDQLCALRKRWNKIVAEYNAVVAPRLRNVGRPLDASPTQQADVLERRKAGQSLRDIADDTTLSLRTVRTIIDKADGVDRATLARLERIDVFRM